MDISLLRVLGRQFQLAVCLLLVVGCNSGVRPPDVDPAEAAAAALELLDTNGDGAIDEAELKAAPGLRAAMYEIDANGDKKATPDEIIERLKPMYAAGVGLTSADCQVTMDGRPLGGATVRYVPEPFLGDATHPAEGTTDGSGFALLAVADELLPEKYRGRGKMQVGLYRIEITHPSIELPPRYNTETELGFELHPYSHIGSSAKFRLTKKKKK